MIELQNITDWDAGNSSKNLLKHGVSQIEAEQVFYSQPIIVVDDIKHSEKEPRFHIYGKNDDGELRHVTFTVCNTKIRIISARKMHRKEKKFYEKNT